MATILIKDVDQQVKKDFYAACIKAGTTMTAELKRHMEQYAKKQEAKK